MANKNVAYDPTYSSYARGPFIVVDSKNEEIIFHATSLQVALEEAEYFVGAYREGAEVYERIANYEA